MMSQFVYSSTGIVSTVRTQQGDELNQSTTLKNELRGLDGLKTLTNYQVCHHFAYFYLQIFSYYFRNMQLLLTM